MALPQSPCSNFDAARQAEHLAELKPEVKIQALTALSEDARSRVMAFMYGHELKSLLPELDDKSDIRSQVAVLLQDPAEEGGITLKAEGIELKPEAPIWFRQLSAQQKAEAIKQLPVSAWPFLVSQLKTDELRKMMDHMEKSERTRFFMVLDQGRQAELKTAIFEGLKAGQKCMEMRKFDISAHGVLIATIEDEEINDMMTYMPPHERVKLLLRLTKERSKHLAESFLPEGEIIEMTTSQHIEDHERAELFSYLSDEEKQQVLMHLNRKQKARMAAFMHKNEKAGLEKHFPSDSSDLMTHDDRQPASSITPAGGASLFPRAEKMADVLEADEVRRKRILLTTPGLEIKYEIQGKKMIDALLIGFYETRDDDMAISEVFEGDIKRDEEREPELAKLEEIDLDGLNESMVVVSRRVVINAETGEKEEKMVRSVVPLAKLCAINHGLLDKIEEVIRSKEAREKMISLLEMIRSPKIFNGTTIERLADTIETFIWPDGTEVAVATAAAGGVYEQKAVSADRAIVGRECRVIGVVDGMGGEGNDVKSGEVVAQAIANVRSNLSLLPDSIQQSFRDNPQLTGNSGAAMAAMKIVMGEEIVPYLSGDIGPYVFDEKGNVKFKPGDEVKFKRTPQSAFAVIESIARGVLSAEKKRRQLKDYMWKCCDTIKSLDAEAIERDVQIIIERAMNGEMPIIDPTVISEPVFRAIRSVTANAVTAEKTKAEKNKKGKELDITVVNTGLRFEPGDSVLLISDIEDNFNPPTAQEPIGEVVIIMKDVIQRGLSAEEIVLMLSTELDNRIKAKSEGRASGSKYPKFDHGAMVMVKLPNTKEIIDEAPATKKEPREAA